MNQVKHTSPGIQKIEEVDLLKVNAVQKLHMQPLDSAVHEFTYWPWHLAAV